MTTLPQKKALAFARSLVEKELCACVNIIEKMQSVYRWQGRVEVEAESILLCKTRSELLEQCAAFIEQTHEYDTPEILTFKDVTSSGSYAAFVRDSTREKTDGSN